MRREGSTNESQSPFTCPPIRYQFSEVLIFFGSLAAPRAIILHLLRQMRREGSTNERQSPFTCPPIRYQFSEVLNFFGSLAAPRARILHLLSKLKEDNFDRISASRQQPEQKQTLPTVYEEETNDSATMLPYKRKVDLN
uniref:Uncharacterized protein n=1 Tax=Ascaris lumbricoides TaxID=6252 RepID=A0A0M3IB52_ASCLU